MVRSAVCGGGRSGNWRPYPSIAVAPTVINRKWQRVVEATRYHLLSTVSLPWSRGESLVSRVGCGPDRVRGLPGRGPAQILSRDHVQIERMPDQPRQPSFGAYSGLQIAVNGTNGRSVAPLP